MNRLGKNELMLGRHYTLDEMLERIDQVKLTDVHEIMAAIMAEPCAVALVGANEKVLSGIGREFIVSNSVETVAGE